MSDPEFKVGDAVEFEVCSDGFPIWNMDEYCSAYPLTTRTHEIERGFVGEVSRNKILVKWNNAHGKRSWLWPNQGHACYDPRQWDRQGYLRKLKSVEATTEAKTGCNCDSFTLTWHGHEEGCVEKK